MTLFARQEGSDTSTKITLVDKNGMPVNDPALTEEVATALSIYHPQEDQPNK